MGQPLPESPEHASTDTWIGRVRFPAVSGKASAVLLIFCLVLTGLIVVPMAKYFEVPTWIRFEILVGIWWIVWAIVLSRLLYSGRRISDDHALASPRNW